MNPKIPALVPAFVFRDVDQNDVFPGIYRDSEKRYWLASFGPLTGTHGKPVEMTTQQALDYAQWMRGMHRDGMHTWEEADDPVANAGNAGARSEGDGAKHRRTLESIAWEMDNLKASIGSVLSLVTLLTDAYHEAERSVNLSAFVDVSTDQLRRSTESMVAEIAKARGQGNEAEGGAL